MGDSGNTGDGPEVTSGDFGGTGGSEEVTMGEFGELREVWRDALKMSGPWATQVED